jgi:hypothetical protein
LQEALARIAEEHLRVFRASACPTPTRKGRARSWGPLALPWRWFGMISHSTHPTKMNRRHPASSRRPMAHESRV